MVLAKPKSITPHKKFMSEVYVLRKDEGGRHKAFFTGYRPQFYIRTMDVTGTITLPEGVEMVMPGDSVNLQGRTDHARSRWKKAPSSPSAKAASPSARVSSPKSWNKYDMSGLGLAARPYLPAQRGTEELWLAKRKTSDR